MRSEPRRAEQLDLGVRKVGLGEDAVPDRVVDVVVDVRDAVDDANDLALERLRLLRARVREDAVAHLMGEVEPPRDAQRLLVVAEPPAERCVESVVERLLARVAERRVAGVVTKADRLDEILVEAERPRDDARDGRRLERVRHPGAVVIAFRIDEDLRLPLQPAERLRVHEAVAVALKRGADGARFLRHQRAHGFRTSEPRAVTATPPPERAHAPRTAQRCGLGIPWNGG